MTITLDQLKETIDSDIESLEVAAVNLRERLSAYRHFAALLAITKQEQPQQELQQELQQEPQHEATP